MPQTWQTTGSFLIAVYGIGFGLVIMTGRLFFEYAKLGRVPGYFTLFIIFYFAIIFASLIARRLLDRS